MSERNPIQDVNIEFGDDVSRIMYEASKKTFQNRPGLMEEMHESFSGFRALPLGKLHDVSNLYSHMDFDGVGTKVEVSERMEDHSVVAYDLFAMVCDDAVVRGAEPLTIGTTLNVRQLNEDTYTRNAVTQLAIGYVAAAEAAGVVVINGEVAELGDRVGGHGEFNYNWEGTTWWVAHKDRIITGKDILPGNSLIGFKEHGFRSNGITDVHKGMLEKYGPHWQHEKLRELGDVSLGKLVQRPSTIYTKLMNSLTGGYDIRNQPKAVITGAAHITGGGQPSKLGRMLEPSGYGVYIDNPIEPPKIMKEVQHIRRFSDKKAYGKWHMGPGMVVVTSTPREVLDEAERFGVQAQEIGFVTEESEIRIKNRGYQQESEDLVF